MSFMGLFRGSSPEKLEKKGDALLRAGKWGHAKLTYERALSKLPKKSDQDILNVKERLEKMVLTARNGLAREHVQNADEMLESGFPSDACELLELAKEVNADQEFDREISKKLEEAQEKKREVKEESEVEIYYGLSEEEEDVEPGEADEDFFAMVATLPEAVRDAYLGYGEEFKSGYLALNRGEFMEAAERLSRALERDPSPDSLIPLELATALINLDRAEEAEKLLRDLMEYHSDALPVYQLLCEIYWEWKDFMQVEELLASIPKELSDTLAVALMKGENYYRSGSYEAAVDFFEAFLQTYAWSDAVAMELAKVYEAMGRQDDARGMYRKIMNRCTSCHAHIDPAVKHRYAELSFEAGMRGDDILEIYLALTREMPVNIALYYERISAIYAAKGNEEEALRFRAFMANLKK